MQINIEIKEAGLSSMANNRNMQSSDSNKQI